MQGYLGRRQGLERIVDCKTTLNSPLYQCRGDPCTFPRCFDRSDERVDDERGFFSCVKMNK